MSNDSPFPLGSTVVLINDDAMSAEVGAKAIVRGYSQYNNHRMVNIAWIKDNLAGSQQDGDYWLNIFRSEINDWDK